jgi:hypothetical protein
MVTNANPKRELDEAEVFHILGNDRRRATIRNLTESGGTIAVSELAERIAAYEADTAEQADDLYKSVYVSLRQTHLPKLEDQGVIEYDPDTQTIRPGKQMEQIRVYTETPSRVETLKQSIYLFLSSIGLLVVVGAELGVPVLSALDTELWAAVVLVLIIVVSLFQSYR